MNQRGFAWVDESAEHSDADEARASALAKKWSSLHHEDEQRRFARESDYEDGRDDGPELDVCEACDGTGLAACLLDSEDNFELPTCTAEGCVDGYITMPLVEYRRRQQEFEAERRLEVELVEDKLALIGARMMRPYEHWNEDEARMAYSEGEGIYG